MARRPARYTPGPRYSVPSFKTLKTIQAARQEHVPSGGGVSYATYKFSAPRAEASGKRSYRDSRGRVRWGKPHVVQRYHRKRRS